MAETKLTVNNHGSLRITGRIHHLRCPGAGLRPRRSQYHIPLPLRPFRKKTLLRRQPPQGSASNPRSRLCVCRPQPRGAAVGDPLSTIKPAVRNLQPYTLKHFRAPVKVNQNENPFDMPEEVKGAVNRAVSGTAWCRYPDFVPTSLISQLADFSHWKKEGVLVGNGSNELIEALMVVVVERGKRVVFPQPTFTLYGMFARILGGACREVPLKPDLEFDGPRLLQEAS